MSKSVVKTTDAVKHELCQHHALWLKQKRNSASANLFADVNELVLETSTAYARHVYSFCNDAAMMKPVTLPQVRLYFRNKWQVLTRNKLTQHQCITIVNVIMLFADTTEKGGRMCQSKS